MKAEKKTGGKCGASCKLQAARRVTWVGFWSNLGLSAAKIVAGVFGHSGAMIADGIHSLSDLASDLVVLVMVGISHKRPDREHPFGHGKYETLATLMLAALLIMVAGGIFWEGFTKVISSSKGTLLSQPGWEALAVCIASIACKEWLYQYTRRVGERIHSEAIVANAWHHRSDAFSSIATLAGVAGAIFLGPGWRILDPFAAMVVAVFIAIVGIRLVISAFRELTGVALDNITIDEIKRSISSTAGVLTFHHLRTAKSGGDCIVEVHLKVDPDISVWDAHAIATAVEKNIKANLRDANAVYVNTHIEPYKGEPILPDGSCK